MKNEISFIKIVKNEQNFSLIDLNHNLSLSQYYLSSLGEKDPLVADIPIPQLCP